MELTGLIKQMQAEGFEIRKSDPFSFGSAENCREMFEAAFKGTDLTAAGRFEWLPEYDQIIDWMVHTEGKGLFLVGSNGRGKSAILMGALPVIIRAGMGKVLKPVSALDLGPDKLWKQSWAIAIDDIGQENIINDYGTRVDAVEEAISHCELKMKLIFLTSNLNEEQLLKRYGVRITDRLNRLCRIVVFKGKSLRK
jgi:DNA replication protein DnaC